MFNLEIIIRSASWLSNLATEGIYLKLYSNITHIYRDIRVYTRAGPL